MDILLTYIHSITISTGTNYINIGHFGDFRVGECYLKRRKKCYRGTDYNSDGAILTSDYDAPVMGSFENLNTEFDDYKDDLVLEDIEEEVKTSYPNINVTPLNPKISSFTQGG